MEMLLFVVSLCDLFCVCLFLFIDMVLLLDIALIEVDYQFSSSIEVLNSGSFWYSELHPVFSRLNCAFRLDLIFIGC